MCLLNFFGPAYARKFCRSFGYKLLLCSSPSARISFFAMHNVSGCRLLPSKWANILLFSFSLCSEHSIFTISANSC
uniref:Uncharacterized protein n=1 Tax=Arundo donax TaxID=35708 RepID=A0A0A8Y082_ARUDO